MGTRCSNQKTICGEYKYFLEQHVKYLLCIISYHVDIFLEYNMLNLNLIYSD